MKVQTKAKYNITIENESKNKRLFLKYKDDILEYAYFISENNLDFDVNIKIIFKKIKSKKEFVKNEIDDAETLPGKNKKSFLVCVSSDLLNVIKRDGGRAIAICLWHEFAHIYDLYQIINNKYFKINPFLRYQKSLIDYGIVIGARFWTEFFAYRCTYQRFDENYPTKLNLVKALDKLDEDYKKMVINYEKDHNKESLKKELRKLSLKIKQFIYALAKHIAGIMYGKNNGYTYCENTQNKANFKFIDKLCLSIARRMEPFLKNTYGKGLKRKLWLLGKLLVEKLFFRYNIGPIKKNGYVIEAYFLE